MAIQNRATVVAINKETTEGTLVFPDATTDFIPIEDDFEMSADFDSLESDELKNSLGSSKPIQGSAHPSCSFSLYLKHSGTSGTAPNYGSLLEGVFGEFDDAGVEHTTTSSSTVSTVKLASGGSTYQKGQLLLVQDGTNGYNIRPVYSISTNDLLLAFDLPSAPASGVSLGEAIMYRPATTGHPTLSVFQYLGNGGAVQAMSGGRVTEVSLEFNAGDLINASYSVEGLKFYYNPIDITSSSKYLDFNIGASALAAVVAVKTYADPHELASALQTAMNAVSADAITVAYSNSTGKFTISTAGSTLVLLWNTGTNTANSIATKVGFTTAANSTAATTYTGANAQTLTAAYSPAFDNADPLVAKNNQVLFGDSTDTSCVAASSVKVTFSLDKADVKSVCAETGISGTVPSKRSCKISMTVLLSQYDVDKFRRFRENDDARFMYAFGEKSGGNWVKGKCGAVYSPSVTIRSLKITNSDDVAYAEMELETFVDSNGNPEIFLGFV